MYKAILITTSALLSFGAAYFAANISVTTNNYNLLIVIALTLAIVTLVCFAISIGADLDNSALLNKIKSKQHIRITHRGKSEIIDEKIKHRSLIPHGVVARGPIQRALGKCLLEKIDGKERVTWVSLGYPADSKDWQLGILSNKHWDKAISFCVTPDKISAPNSLIKKIFGRHQLVLKEKIALNGGEDVYIKKDSQWMLLEKTQPSSVRA